MMRYGPGWLLFASDALLVALAGTGMLLLAVFAALMDWRRQRRDRLGAPDRVGWMPWTGLLLASVVSGFGLLAAALPGLLGSG